MAMASVVGIFGLIIYYLFVLMLPIALLVALQVWLCRKGTKLGLILPGISLALSLLLVLSMTSFSTLSVGGRSQGGENRDSSHSPDICGRGIPGDQHPHSGFRRHLAALQGPPGYPGGLEKNADRGFGIKNAARRAAFFYRFTVM